uniref:Cytochrome c oxidase subunit 2 n=1 Tax=Stomatella planulata TaxID=529752 RepID=A0A1I9SSW2_9VEST|nr:cytochrome c oxidase subunit II [Stomatella planulata]AOZ71832.1 cytochrome c oxidase subunit II [Stomatella planulata]
MALWGQLGFQDAASPIMEQLIYFHDHAMLILTLIISLVTYFTLSLMTNTFIYRYQVDGQTIETIWTIFPAVVLVFLAFPSLRLLYLLDEVGSCTLTIKSIGHQWYWSYEYSDFMDIEFDSYMVPTNELEEGQYRLLEVDHRAVVPVNANIRVLVTSADVIHSWTVPSLGVKADAIPGRLNQISFFVKRPGIFYGQCSEICGANHSFMPIVLEAVEIDDFAKWIIAVGKNS